MTSKRDFTVVREVAAARIGGDDARRLFHGRGRCYPGFEDLVVDWWPPYVVVGWFPPSNAGAADPAELSPLTDSLSELESVEGVLVQVRQGPRTRVEVCAGDVPDVIEVCEDGLQFEIRPHLNQNVGLFLDMAPARRWLRVHARGKRVLNLFAYTCAFSLSAIAGGAELVVNNDMSRAALDWGRRNHLLNGDAQTLGRVRFVPHNVFRSWWKLEQLGPFDIVVIDPPTRQRGSFVAEKDYGALLKRLPRLLGDSGSVLACLNSPFLPFEFLETAMASRCPGCSLVERLGAAVEFEERNDEQALKVGVYDYHV